MLKNKLIIGSYVSVKPPKYLLGAIEEILIYKANTFMFYTKYLNQIINDKYFKNILIKEFHKKLIKNKININNIIIHASYYINLANIINKKIFQLSINILKQEIIKCQILGVKILILHPGNSLSFLNKNALNQIIYGLNLIFLKNHNVKIALETMSGKGSELGSNFEQLKYIIDNIKKSELIGICWDTCHLFNSGYDINNNLEEIIYKFNKLIGLHKLWVIHINDSKYIFNSRKDRHANLNMGYIGFQNLINIIYHPLLINKIMILETPFINNKPPYLYEIEMIKNKKYNNDFLKLLK